MSNAEQDAALALLGDALAPPLPVAKPGHFRQYADAGYGHLLNPAAPPGSTLAPAFRLPAGALGKVPSAPRRDGTWGPRAGWPNRQPAPGDLETWDAAGANLSLRTGEVEACDPAWKKDPV